jgi:flavin-dependent dehydrogenase
VHATLADGRSESWQARFIIDASGRDTFLGNRLKAKRRNPKHSSAALYGHFRGARRYEDKRAGDISIYWFDHGWFWFIPLADGTTSVGAVVWPYYTKTRAVSVREFYLATIALCAPLAERLQDAELVAEVTATGNYSYACDRAYGANYLLLGDAYTFIDPMFSSGVMLAMNSAVAGVETIDQCLREPHNARQALKSFERVMRRGPKAYSWFIYRVTNPTMREMFLGPRNLLRMKEAVLSLLAGDIFGTTPIWASLRAFKLTYYVVALLNLKRSLAAVRRRASNIRPAEPEQMTAN